MINGQNFWVIHNDELIKAEGFPRDEGYYYFPKITGGILGQGWSIHSNDLFSTKEQAKYILITRLKSEIKKLQDKIKKLEE